METITCASFFGTGSSAVTDFFSEFEGIDFSMGSYEYRFLHDPNGISDLEYNVIENNNRHNTSNAIKNYIRITKLYMNPWYTRGYKKTFGQNFLKYTDEYIHEITQCKATSWWHWDQINKGMLFCFIDKWYSRCRRLFNSMFGKKGNAERQYSLLQRHEIGYYTAISEEKFLEATRNYTDQLLKCANKTHAPFLMVDQLVPPSNVSRYLRYLTNTKVIVVDRDPRDVFLQEREVWRWGVIPAKNVVDFIKWYKITRSNLHKEYDDPDRVLRINFEDLIYKYDDTTKMLCDFVGISLSGHVRPRVRFNPDVSIRGTNLSKKYKGYEDEIAMIERELSDYLYGFPENE